MYRCRHYWSTHRNRIGREFANLQWYSAMVKIKRGLIHVRDAMFFFYFHNKKDFRSREFFGRWSHDQWLRATRTARIMDLIPWSVAKRFMCNNMLLKFGVMKILTNNDMKPGGIIYIEIQRLMFTLKRQVFVMPRDQCHHQTCAGCNYYVNHFAYMW